MVIIFLYVIDIVISVIHVNVSIQEETAIGWLMHDEFLKERVRYFKNTEEEMRRDGLLEGKLESIQKLMSKKAIH